MTANSQRYLFQSTMTDDIELRLFNILDEQLQNLVPGTCFNVAPRPGLLTEEGRWNAASKNDLSMLASSRLKMKLIVPSPDEIQFVTCPELLCDHGHQNAEVLFVRGMNVVAETIEEIDFSFSSPPKIVKYCSGFMLSSYGLWMHHSWCMDDKGRILETKMETTPRGTIPKQGPSGMYLEPGLRFGLAYAVVSVVEDRNQYLLSQCNPPCVDMVQLIMQKDTPLQVRLSSAKALDEVNGNIPLRVPNNEYASRSQQLRLIAQQKMSTSSYIKTVKETSPEEFLQQIAQKEPTTNYNKTESMTRTTELGNNQSQVITTYHHQDYFRLDLEKGGQSSTTVQSHVFKETVRCMVEGIERNQYNHHNGTDTSPRVRLVNLKKTCLNGKEGQRGKWKEHKDRFIVLLDDGTKVGIKPINLEIIPRPKCCHERVQGWKLDQCAECALDLGPERLNQEKEFSKISELRDVLRAHIHCKSSSATSTFPSANLNSMTLNELTTAAGSLTMNDELTTKHGEFLTASAVRLDWLVQFTFAHNCWDWPTWKVVRDIVVPSTNEKRIRFCELEDVEPFVGKSDVFMSHCWSSKWGDLVMAASIGSKKTRYVWIDIFAVRQFPGNGADLDFRAVVKASNALVMSVSTLPGPLTDQNLLTEEDQNKYLDSDIGKKTKSEIPFFRLWCVVELASAVENDIEVVVRCGRAVPTTNSIYHYERKGAMLQMQNLSKMVSVYKAECAVRTDYDREIKYIQDNIEGGLDRINKIVEGQIVGALFSIAHGILAVDAAVCGETSALDDLPLQSSTSLCARVIAAAAGAGRTKILKHLLQHSAIKAMTPADIGKTGALAAAQRGHHDEIVQLLVAAGVQDPSSKETKTLLVNSESIFERSKWQTPEMIDGIGIQNLHLTEACKIAPDGPTEADIGKSIFDARAKVIEEREKDESWSAKHGRENRDALDGEIYSMMGNKSSNVQDHASNLVGLQWRSTSEDVVPEQEVEKVEEIEEIKDMSLKKCKHCGTTKPENNNKPARTMSMAELKAAIKAAGLQRNTLGFVEKREFVKLLEEARQTGDLPPAKLLKCKCKSAIYCGISCQKKNWKHHQQEHRRILLSMERREQAIKFALQSDAAGKAHSIEAMLDYAQKAIDTDSSYYGGYCMRGRILASRGLLDRAVLDLETAQTNAKRENKLEEADRLFSLSNFIFRARGESGASSVTRGKDKNLDFGKDFTGIKHFRKHSLKILPLRNVFTPPPRFHAGNIVASHEFEDAQEKNRQHPTTFIIPSLDEISRIMPLDMIKVCWKGERFYLFVTRKGNGGFVGLVANKMNHRNASYHKIDAGDVIRCEYKHVLDISPSSDAEQQMNADPILMPSFFKQLGVNLDMDEFTFAVEAITFTKQQKLYSTAPSVDERHVRVRLVGLNAVALNGKLGTRTTWDESKGRFKVILDDKDIKKKGYANVKPTNLEIISEVATTHENQNEDNNNDEILHEFESDFSKKTEAAAAETFALSELKELHAACENGSFTVVKRLISLKGFDVNCLMSSGVTPLSVACSNGHLMVVKLLLGCKGIDVNRSDGSNSSSPLLLACAENQKEIVQLLLQVDGIDVNRQMGGVTGTTALLITIASRFIDIARLLIQHPEIDVNKQGDIGEGTIVTPLTIAILCFTAPNRQDFEIVNLLLRHPKIDIRSQEDQPRRSNVNFRMSISQALQVASNQELIAIVTEAQKNKNRIDSTNENKEDEEEEGQMEMLFDIFNKFNANSEEGKSLAAKEITRICLKEMGLSVEKLKEMGMSVEQIKEIEKTSFEMDDLKRLESMMVEMKNMQDYTDDNNVAWDCTACTYRHEGELAVLTSCTMCGSDRSGQQEFQMLIERESSSEETKNKEENCEETAESDDDADDAEMQLALAMSLLKES